MSPAFRTTYSKTISRHRNPDLLFSESTTTTTVVGSYRSQLLPHLPKVTPPTTGQTPIDHNLGTSYQFTMRSIDLRGLAASIAAVSASPGNTSPSTALFSHNVLPECTAGGSLLITHGMHTALESYCSTAANTVIHGPNHINSTLAVDDAPMAVTIEVCDPVDFTVDSLFCFTQFASIVSGCPKTKSGTMTFSDPTVKLSLTANPTDGQQPLPILEEQNLAAVAARTTNTLPDGMSCLYEGTPVDSYGVITNVTEWCKVVDEVAIRPNGTTNRREQDHAGTIWYPEILNLQLHDSMSSMVTSALSCSPPLSCLVRSTGNSTRVAGSQPLARGSSTPLESSVMVCRLQNGPARRAKASVSPPLPVLQSGQSPPVAAVVRLVLQNLPSTTALQRLVPTWLL